MTRRVKVQVTLETGIDRVELRAADMLGPLQIVETTGTPWVIGRLTVAMPENWRVDHPENDLRHTELVLALARSEFDKRGWEINGVCTILEPKP